MTMAIPLSLVLCVQSGSDPLAFQARDDSQARLLGISKSQQFRVIGPHEQVERGCEGD